MSEIILECCHYNVELEVFENEIRSVSKNKNDLLPVLDYVLHTW